MSVREFPYPHRHPQQLGALRLELADEFTEGRLGGRWTPYCRDLTREAAHLIDAFPADRGKIDRLVYAERDWDALETNEVFTRHGRIKVGLLPPSRGTGLVLVRVTGAGIVALGIAWPTGLASRQG